MSQHESNGYVVETQELWRVYETGALQVPALRVVHVFGQDISRLGEYVDEVLELKDGQIDQPGNTQ